MSVIAETNKKMSLTGNGDDLATSGDLGGDIRRCGLGPALNTAEGKSEDIGTVVEATEKSINNDLIRGGAITAEHAVCQKSCLVSNTGDLVLVAWVGADDAGNVGAVATALVQGVIVRRRGVGAGVSIANEVVTACDLVALTETSTEVGVGVVNARVNDGDLDTLAEDTLLVELVDTGDNQGRLGIYKARGKSRRFQLWRICTYPGEQQHPLVT
jgi:hypothetical protein